MSLNPYTPVVESVETVAFVVIVLELAPLVAGASVLRALLRTNLTLRPQLLAMVAHLKQTKTKAKALNQQLQVNQAMVTTGLLSVSKALPKPVRWVFAVLDWLL